MHKQIFFCLSNGHPPTVFIGNSAEVLFSNSQRQPLFDPAYFIFQILY